MARSCITATIKVEVVLLPFNGTGEIKVLDERVGIRKSPSESPLNLNGTVSGSEGGRK